MGNVDPEEFPASLPSEPEMFERAREMSQVMERDLRQRLEGRDWAVYGLDEPNGAIAGWSLTSDPPAGLISIRLSYRKPGERQRLLIETEIPPDRPRREAAAREYPQRVLTWAQDGVDDDEWLDDRPNWTPPGDLSPARTIPVLTPTARVDGQLLRWRDSSVVTASIGGITVTIVSRGVDIEDPTVVETGDLYPYLARAAVLVDEAVARLRP